MSAATDKLRAAMIEEFRKGSGVPRPAKAEDPVVKTAAAEPVIIADDPPVGTRYSELLGDTFNTSRCTVKVFADGDWHEDVRSFIPQPYTTYIPREEDYVFATLLEAGEFTCLVGEPGTGKDYMARQHAALCRRPYQRITCMRNLTPDMLLGKFMLVDGNMVWNPGVVELMVRHGGTLVISEFAAMPADTDFALQSLKERGGYLTLMEHPDPSQRMLYPHPEFRMVLTSNVRGVGDRTDMYAGTGVMDASSLNRIEAMVTIPYMSPDKEAELLSNETGIDADLARKMVRLGALVRTACSKGEIEATWSPRNLLAWGRISRQFGCVKDGFKYSFCGKLSDTELSAVRNLWHTVGFSKEL